MFPEKKSGYKMAFKMPLPLSQSYPLWLLSLSSLISTMSIAVTIVTVIVAHSSYPSAHFGSGLNILPPLFQLISCKPVKYSFFLFVYQTFKYVNTAMYSLCNKERIVTTHVLFNVSFVFPRYLIAVSHSLATAFCEEGCRYGGTCVAPNQCACPSGFTGSHCEKGNPSPFEGVGMGRVSERTEALLSLGQRLSMVGHRNF